ncbi:MAG: hypothetical protein PHN31_01645 [Candidatus Gracilibacteria bacterium]|nr:hypothetical protein [Candidatus Gracilibacteria bacterium]
MKFIDKLIKYLLAKDLITSSGGRLIEISIYAGLGYFIDMFAFYIQTGVLEFSTRSLLSATVVPLLAYWNKHRRDIITDEKTEIEKQK